METLFDALFNALQLLFSPTHELLEIIFLTLKVSGFALAFATIVGLPIGATLALRRFPLRGFLIALLNAFMGLPPVVVGLFLYIMLSRSGPLGIMGLLYTPKAMIIAQFILAVPFVAALSQSAVVSVDNRIILAAKTLGGSPRQVRGAVIREARYGILSSVIAAFGRVMAEVGAVLLVGGNIAGHTRVMTTTIALETDKGDFSLAMALGIILLAISISVNIALYFVQRRAKHES
jgi:tungstate transport system permease protein